MPWPSAGSRQPPRITLVDPKERFVFLPLLIDYAVGGDVELNEFAPEYRELLMHAEADRARVPQLPGTGPAALQYVQGSASAVDWRRRRAVLSDASGEEQNFGFEAVVVSPGQLARPAVKQIPGLASAAEAGTAQAFVSLSDAEALRARLAAGAPSSVAVVGAGYIGVELAAALAEELSGRVALFGASLLRGSEQANVRRAAERLEAQGVQRKEGRVVAVDGAGVSWAPAGSTAEPERFECDLVLVTGALAECLADPRLRLQLDFGKNSVGEDGRVQVDPFMRAAPGVYCIGDAAAGAAATGQAAMQQAEIASWNAFAQCAGLPRAVWRKYAPSALGEYIALGRDTAAAVVDAAQLGKLLPTALPPAAAAVVNPLVGRASAGSSKVDLGGRPAALLRRLSYLYRMPTLGHRAWVAQQWAARAKEGAALPA